MEAEPVGNKVGSAADSVIKAAFVNAAGIENAVIAGVTFVGAAYDSDINAIFKAKVLADVFLYLINGFKGNAFVSSEMLKVVD